VLGLRRRAFSQPGHEDAFATGAATTSAAGVRTRDTDALARVSPPKATAAVPLPEVHGSLRPLLEAARRTRANIAVLPVPMVWRSRSWLPGNFDLLVRTPVYALAHLRLVADLWRLRRRRVLVREFLSPFLLLVWPLVWPLRRRCYFLSHHNLQAAFRGGLENFCLRLLLRTGFRMALLETSAGIEALGVEVPPAHLLVLPHPSDIAPAKGPQASAVSALEPVVGVVGAIRREKGSEALLEELLRLRANGRLSARLLLGCPEPEVRARWHARGFEVVDTTRRDDYEAALERCHAVVLNYRRDRYYYRASGVAADALNHRTVVVSPNFPVMRSQLTYPVKVGCLYRNLDGLESAIEQALAIRPEFEEALERYEAERGVEATAARLDDFLSKGSSR